MYGVIIDATLPYLKNRSICSLKLIDETLNSKSARQISFGGLGMQQLPTGYGRPHHKPAGEMSMTSMKVNLLAKSIESLPYVFRIGDIIRVHRCNVGEYNNELNLTGNVYQATSWVVFSGNTDFHHSYENSQETLTKRTEGEFIRMHTQEEDKRLIQE